jgi:hypothetical protein
MIHEKKIIEKWETTGFLNNKSHKQKLVFALNLAI